MNLQPDEQKNDVGINEEKQLQQVLDQQYNTTTYMIFVKVNDISYKKEISLTQDATIEEAIYKAIDFDNPDFSNVEIDDLYFYMSSKDGTPKEYFPPMDKSQKISRVNYHRFVITLQQKTQPNVDPIKDQQEEVKTTYCGCFGSNKKDDREKYLEAIQFIYLSVVVKIIFFYFFKFLQYFFYLLKIMFNDDILDVKFECQNKDDLQQVETLKANQLQIIENYKKFDVLQCVEDMNGSGIYQQRVLLIMIAMIFACSFSQYSLPFTFLNPKTYCYMQNDELQQCSLKEACKNQDQFVVSDSQFISFQMQFNKICDENYIDRIQTMILIIASVGSLLMNFLQDIIGRIKVIKFAILIGILSYFLIGFQSQQQIVVSGISVSLLFNDALCSCFYSYFPEIMGKKLRNKTSGAIFLAMTIVSITITFISNYLSSYQQIAQIGFFVNLAGLLVIIYFVETPLYSYSKGNLLNVYDSLRYIQKENLNNDSRNKDDLHKRIFGFKFNINSCKNFNIKTQAKKNRLLFQEKLDLFFLLFIDLQIYLTSFLYILEPQKLGIKNDIRLNLYITTLGEVIGYFLISIYSIIIPRKKFFIYYINLSLLFALISIIFYYFEFQKSLNGQILQLFISFLFKILVGAAFAMLYNYIAEMVRTEVRGLAVGIMVFSGRVIVSFLPFVMNFQNNHNLSPFTFIFLMSILNQFVVYKLPKTLNKTIK